MTTNQRFRKKIKATLGATREIQTLVWLAFIAIVALAAVPAQQAGTVVVGPIVQHGPAATLVLPAPARAEAKGASATLLPDGRWLLLGGTRKDGTGVLGTARLYDPIRRTLETLKTGLAQARAFHSASPLPDGQVLVVGGLRSDGTVETVSELFEPASVRSRMVPEVPLIARNHHRTTVLADGRVLITGGQDARGLALFDAELFDPRSSEVERIDARLDTGRLDHSAALLPSHSVLLRGGIGDDGRPVADAEMYDPDGRHFTPYDPESARTALAALETPAAPAVIDSDRAHRDRFQDSGLRADRR